MARSVRSRLRIGRRYVGAGSGDIVLDGVGARNRQEARNRSFRERLHQELPGALERMVQRATDEIRPVPTRDELLAKLRMKQVPELMTVDAIYELHESLQPEAPAYRVNPELLGAIGIAGVLQGVPNLEKFAMNEAIGPHFDEYRSVGANWTLWGGVKGSGTLQACFLDDASLYEYQQAVTENGGEALDERMRYLRGQLGTRCLGLTRPKFIANYEASDWFLLWHGSQEDGAKNPGVHSFDRAEEGAYTIHAVAKSLGEFTPSGFTRLN